MTAQVTAGQKVLIIGASGGIGSAAVQIAIVLASASIITTMPVLVWIAGGLGVVGVAFGVIGAFFPMAVHLF